MKLWEELAENTVKEMTCERELLPAEIIKTIIENKCYFMLNKIRDIIINDENSDEDCFEKIEEIVRLFEEMDISIGSRHDFG